MGRHNFSSGISPISAASASSSGASRALAAYLAESFLTSSLMTGGQEYRDKNLVGAVLDNDTHKAKIVLEAAKNNPDLIVTENYIALQAFDMKINKAGYAYKEEQEIIAELKPSEGKRLLQIACEQRNREMVVLLLQFGADASDINFSGITITAAELAKGRYIYEAKGLDQNIIVNAIELQQDEQNQRTALTAYEKELTEKSTLGNQKKELADLQKLQLELVDSSILLTEDEVKTILEVKKIKLFYKDIENNIKAIIRCCYDLQSGLIPRKPTSIENKVSFVVLGISAAADFAPTAGTLIKGGAKGGEFVYHKYMNKQKAVEFKSVSRYLIDDDHIAGCAKTIAFFLTRAYEKTIQDASIETIEEQIELVCKMAYQIMIDRKNGFEALNGTSGGHYIATQILAKKELFNHADFTQGKINRRNLKQITIDNETLFEVLPEEERIKRPVSFIQIMRNVVHTKFIRLEHDQGDYYITPSKSEKIVTRVSHWLEVNLDRNISSSDQSKLENDLLEFIDKAERDSNYPILSSLYHPLRSAWFARTKKSVRIERILEEMQDAIAENGIWEDFRIKTETYSFRYHN